MRHLAIPRSTRKHLQRLTAFLLAVAVITGFLPLNAVKVLADGDHVVEIDVDYCDNNDYNTALKVEYYTSGDVNDWTEVAPAEGTTNIYSFPGDAVTDDGDIFVRFSLDKNAAEEDPRVFTGITVFFTDETSSPLTPVIDEFYDEDDLDLCSFTIPYDVNAGVSKVVLRVSNPENIEFIQENDYKDKSEWNNGNFYQFRKDRDLGEVTIKTNKMLEIFGADVSIDKLVFEEGSRLQIMDNDEDYPEDSAKTGTLTVTNIVGAKDATILFRTSANIPEKLKIYHWTGGDHPELVEDGYLDGWEWINVFYDVEEEKWILDEYDPYEVRIIVSDDSNLFGTPLTYSVEYQLEGLEWTEADFEERYPDDFYPGNINGNTITIDQDQQDLKVINFRMPEAYTEVPEGSNNWVYPLITFKITIENYQDFESIDASIKNGDSWINFEEDYDGGNLVLTATGLDFDAISHEIYLTLDSGIDRNDCFGMNLCMPFDDGSGCVTSDDGKTVTFTAFDGNQLIITNDDTMYVEYIQGDKDQSSMYRVWAIPEDDSAESSTFAIEASPSQDYVASYKYRDENNEEVRDILPVVDSGEDPYEIVADQKGQAIDPDLGFDKNSLNFERYESISPAPFDEDNADGELTEDSYTITYEGGTITVKILADEPDWYGRTEERLDDWDEEYISSFKIETRSQVQLTFAPYTDEGYEIDPWILNNYIFTENDPYTTQPFYLSTESNYFNDPFRKDGEDPGPDMYFYGIKIEDSNFAGTSLTYQIQYSLDGGNTWKGAEILKYLPDDFPCFGNIDQTDKTVTSVLIDNDQQELKELFFRLPDDASEWVETSEGSGEWIEIYPDVLLKITITYHDKLTLNSATLANQESSYDLNVSEGTDGTIVITTDAININDDPHDIVLTFDNSFFDDYYGLNVVMPFGENNNYVLSDDGKTVTIDSCDGNQMVVKSDDPIYITYIHGAGENPPKFSLWSESGNYSVTALPAQNFWGYLNNLDGIGMREMLPNGNDPEATPYPIPSETKGKSVEASFNFEVGKISFECYTDISPEGKYNTFDREDWNRNEELSSDTYTLTFEGGTVTIALADPENGVWSGCEEYWHDDYDDQDHEQFRIDTKDLVTITFIPDEGYEVNPVIYGSPDDEEWILDLDSSYSITTELETERTFMNQPFVKAPTPGWNEIDGQYYYFENGEFLYNSWIKDGNKTYYVGDDGARVTGRQKIDGDFYYFKTDGRMATGWKTLGSYSYYFDPATGKAVTGWQTIDGAKYYFKSNWKMQTGWKVTSGGTAYYLDADGKMVTGLKEIEGKTYYFSDAGKMQTGFITIGNYTYYFDESGVMQTGRVKLNGVLYYFKTNGRMVTGFKELGNYTYYFDPVTGAAVTGWQTIDGYRYYFKTNGKMQTGWKYTSSGAAYYFDPDTGRAVTGWQTIDGYDYYFGSNGKLISGYS